jgi:hypothetical protein
MMGTIPVEVVVGELDQAFVAAPVVPPEVRLLEDREDGDAWVFQRRVASDAKPVAEPRDEGETLCRQVEGSHPLLYRSRQDSEVPKGGQQPPRDLGTHGLAPAARREARVRQVVQKPEHISRSDLADAAPVPLAEHVDDEVPE